MASSPASASEPKVGPVAIKARRDGDNFLAAAEEKLTAWSLFGMYSAQYKEEAVHLFKNAGVKFKMGKAWDKCGAAYIKAARQALANGNKLDCIPSFKEAGKAYEKTDTDKAVQAYNECINHYMDNNRFNQAAKMHEAIAEILKKQGKSKKALEAYQNCIDCFDAENDEVNARKRKEYMAELHGSIEQYQEAVLLYEEIGYAAVGNNLMRYSAAKFYFHALLCKMCLAAEALKAKGGDYKDHIEECREALERYQNTADIINGKREINLINDILTTIEEVDDHEKMMETYQDHVHNYDRIQRMTPWQIDRMFTIKAALEADEGEPDLMGGGGSDDGIPDMGGGDNKDDGDDDDIPQM